MDLLIHQLLLLGSIAALAAAGWRLASAAVPSGLLRAVATAPLAAGAAVLSAIVLGLAGLGANPVALTAAAVGIWLLTWRSVGRPEPPPRGQLATWWSGLSVAGRVARAGLAGALIGYGVWVLRHPVLGVDALNYHLALPVDWVHNGRPGSLVAVWDGLPLENYGLTHEVLVAWVTGIARTLVPAMLVTPGTLLLLGASVRVGLGEAGVCALLSWLAAGGLVTLPIVVVELAGPNTDLPAMAWLACAVALLAAAAPRATASAGHRSADGAGHRSRLLAVALVAAGLGVGTKTTVAPLAAFALVIGGWRLRRELRRLVVPLILAAALAAVIGCFWYVRNLIDHGAPFWPLLTTPWGDPIPAPFRAIDASLLSNLSATLDGRIGAYGRVVAGGVMLLAGALLSPLWARRRLARWAALIVVAALLVWAASPYTGISLDTALAVGATRYLLPCLLAAAVAVALAGRGESAPRRVPTRAQTASLAALALALGVNLDRDAALSFPTAPSARSLLLVAALGAAVAIAAEWLVRMPAAATRTQLARWITSMLALAAALAALLLPVDGYMAGHAGAGLADAGLVRWLHSRAAFRSGREPVLIGPVAVAVLTGARLAHPLVLIRASDRCPELARQARSSWVVIENAPEDAAYDRRWTACLAGQRPAYADGSFVVYATPALTVPS